MNKNKTKFYIINAMLLVVLIGIIGISASYAFINVTTSTTEFTNPKINSSIECVDLTYNETAVINLDHKYPLTDTQGAQEKPLTVTITNSCSNEVVYSLVISSLTKDGTDFMNDNQVKIKVEKNSAEQIQTKILSELTTVDANSNAYKYLTTDLTNRENVKDYSHRASYYIVQDVTLGSNGTDTYSVRLWIDYNEGGNNNSTEGKSFAATLSSIVA